MALKTIDNGRTAQHFESVTPSDSTALSGGVCSGLFIGTGGDIVILNSVGNPITFKNLASGSYLDCQTTRVNATGTTATDIVALY
jgi:hypothetical protein